MTKESALWRFCLIESKSENQKSSKVNMKSTICHNFPSADLLEGPKDGKLKENGKFFIIRKFFITALVHLTTDHEVHL